MKNDLETRQFNWTVTTLFHMVAIKIYYWRHTWLEWWLAPDSPHHFQRVNMWSEIELLKETNFSVASYKFLQDVSAFPLNQIKGHPKKRYSIVY